MDEDKEQGVEVSLSAEGVSPEDRERAHLEHARIVEGAAKAHAPEPTDAEVIAEATDRHLEDARHVAGRERLRRADGCGAGGACARPGARMTIPT